MSDTAQAALVSGAVALVIWFLSNWADRRSKAAANVIENRRLNTEGKAVDLSVLQASIENLRGRVAEVENDLEHEKCQRRMSNEYARTLAQVLRDNDMPVPLAPEGLDID